MLRIEHPPGLSVVESLLLVAVLGLTVVIVGPTVRAAGQAGRRATCMSHLRQIGRAYAMYREEHGRYPGAPELARSPYLADRRVLFCPADRAIAARGAASSYHFRRRVPPDFAAIAAARRVAPQTVLANCDHHLDGALPPPGEGRAPSTGLRAAYHLVLRADGSVESVPIARIRWFNLPGDRATFTPAYPGEPGYERAAVTP